MRLAWEHRRARLYQGDCRDVLPTLTPASLDCVVTSPPYAEQRKGFYDGVPEAEYPAFTVAWLASLRPALKERGSVLINIREHVAGGQISDYVHRTRLAVRDAGWIECDELIWIKPAAPPVGHPMRPRRSWERILWFSPSRHPWCDPRANGEPSLKIGKNWTSRNDRSWVSGASKAFHAGVSRSTDYICAGVNAMAQTGHPAAYPVTLAAWCLRLVCPPDGLSCDPFSGSGTTGLAALRLGMGYVGIEKDDTHVTVSVARLRGAAAQTSIFEDTAEVPA
jgi:site-specific DNA-methyltransferase (adenine-specific)/site-specific DNA-methyltransferase (cytosine-N4-specific)